MAMWRYEIYLQVLKIFLSFERKSEDFLLLVRRPDKCSEHFQNILQDCLINVWSSIFCNQTHKLYISKSHQDQFS